MLNIEEQQPHLTISPAMLSFYGPNTAVLYAYLKYYWEENNIEITPFKDNPYYKFSLRRNEIKRTTGLSFGQQIDSEMDLCGAFLADSYPEENESVKYNFYPHHEDEVRRWIYEKQYNWLFPSQLKA